MENSTFILRNQLEVQDLRREIREGGFYLRISGGLGNQIFGVSEAVRIAKIKSKVPYIEFIETEHRNQSDHTQLLEFMRSKFHFILIIRLSEIPIYSSFEIKNLASIDDFEICASFAFEGWLPNIKTIEATDVFVQGIFPLPIKTESLPPNSAAIHLRIGDYKSHPYLGIVTKSYYRSAIKILMEENGISHFFLFSDSPEIALSRIDSKLVRFEVVNADLSPLETLQLMSTATFLIAANSTFSFWASYFSMAKTFVPFPFYLSNWDWDNKLWNQNIRRIRQCRYPRWLALKYWWTSKRKLFQTIIARFI